MGYLDDISQVLKTIKRAPVTSAMNDVDDALSPLKHKSITKGAMDGTMQFPCLIPDSIPIDMAATIARMLERVYATFVQTYLSLNSTIDISVDKNATQFLKKFHQNVRMEFVNDVTDEDEYREYMERVYDGKAKLFVNNQMNRAIVFNITDDKAGAIYESHKKQLTEFLAGIDFRPIPNIGNSPFYNYVKEADDAESFTPMDLLRAQAAGRAAERDANNTQLHNNAIERERIKSELSRKREGMSTPRLDDRDVKKSNDLQPYTMQVRLMAVNGEQEFVQFMDFVVGVKVNLHVINSEEMAVNIINAISNNGFLANFFKWTTGEKSLVKDLLLNIDATKLDAANKSRGASPWWTTLKRMKATSRRQLALMQRNVIVPTGTLVLCSTDVDYITKKSGYNLKDPRIAIKLRDALYLMNIIIVDTGTRTLEVLYDGTTSYQTFALETIEREVAASSNKLGRELTRMISR
jgi:hypothetical protein